MPFTRSHFLEARDMAKKKAKPAKKVAAKKAPARAKAPAKKMAAKAKPKAAKSAKPPRAAKAKAAAPRKARGVSPIPEGLHSVTANLVLPRCAEAIEFYKEAFGAVEIS